MRTVELGAGPPWAGPGLPQGGEPGSCSLAWLSTAWPPTRACPPPPGGLGAPHSSELAPTLPTSASLSARPQPQSPGLSGETWAPSTTWPSPASFCPGQRSAPPPPPALGPLPTRCASAPQAHLPDLPCRSGGSWCLCQPAQPLSPGPVGHHHLPEGVTSASTSHGRPRGPAMPRGQTTSSTTGAAQAGQGGGHQRGGA